MTCLSEIRRVLTSIYTLAQGGGFAGVGHGELSGLGTVVKRIGTNDLPPPSPIRSLTMLSLAAALLSGSLVFGAAQPPAAEPPAGEPARVVEGPQGVKLEDLPPPMRLGLRVEITRRQLPLSAVVVIVPDVRSYVEAIAGWSLRDAGRYPVLIDDGTLEGHEDIARFVRAFAPARVVRWSAPADLAGPWPTEATKQRERVEAALRRAWKPATNEAGAMLVQMYKSVNHTPPGIVATSMADTAWTAALALAAGRGQVLAFVDGPTSGGDAGGTLTLAQTDALSEQIVKACSEAGLSFAGLGDDLDSVTLCLNVPTKTTIAAGSNLRPAGPFTCKPGEPVATSDLIGRTVTDRGDRWAWCGQVFGSASQSAYRAMSALFLQPSEAWLFDGYETGPPWSQFDCTAAGELLSKAGLTVTIDDSPRQSAGAFRARAVGGWDPKAPKKGTDPAPGGTGAGLIMVNTSGMTENFDLKPGQCISGDVPALRAPALVNFVHSWSANSPSNPSTVAGRWLAHGAFAYVGSVHEPFLQAFVPTPMFAKRMLAPAPLGAAARLDGAPPWRIAVIGDPLLTLGPGAGRVGGGKEIPLAGAEDLKDVVARCLKNEDFENACANLIVSGRDADAVRLGRALLRDKKEKMTPLAAAHLVWACYRQPDIALFAQVYDAARPIEDQHPRLRDLLWHALYSSGTTLTKSQLDLLKAMPRRDSTLRDAEELAGLVKRVSGVESARACLRDLARAERNEYVKQKLEEMATALK